MGSFEFSVMGLAPGLNGKGGLIRLHHQAYKRIRDQWTLEVRAGVGRRVLPVPPCEIIICRMLPRKGILMDIDNLYSTAKVPLDALRHAGVIAEDDPDHVLSLAVRQVKCPEIPNYSKAFTRFSISW